MVDPDKYASLVFGEGFERCPRTGRPFERGIGALSKSNQTAMFLREAAFNAGEPKEGETCVQTGRAFDCSNGAPTKPVQTEQFLRELSPADKAERQAAANALAAVQPAGTA